MGLDGRTEARLKKLMALAERGEGGEKETASRMLDKLLKKHGLTLDDLSGEQKAVHWFPFKGAFERRLAGQVLAMVCDTTTPHLISLKSKRGQFGIEATPSEAVEFDLYYSELRKALVECLNVAYRAFVQTNRIFPATGGVRSPSFNPQDQQVLSMASLIERTHVAKRIAAEREQ